MKDGGLWIAAGPLLLAALALLLNFWAERYRAGKQLEMKKFETEQNRKLKEYEVEFMDRRKSFVELFRALRSLLLLAARHDPGEAKFDFQEFWRAQDERSTAFYNLMPFLPASDHEWLEDQAEYFERLAGKIWTGIEHGGPDDEFRQIEAYEAALKALRKIVFDKLFGAQ